MTHCPGCRKTHPTGTREVPCCNPLCGGNWGTGCYHCHHPSFAPPRDFPEQCLHEKGCELWRVPGTNYCGEHQGGIEALNRGDGCNRDWLAAFTALRDLEAARRQDEATLRNSLAIAQQLVRTERHLDALVVLYRAEDLEFEMTADCQVTGPVTDSLLRQLGLDDETAFEAWCTAQEPHEKDSAS